MKDEIKEILDYFKRSNKNKLGFEQDKIITYKEANQLLDYITNLQEENEILKENAEHNDKVVDKARWNEMIYKSRNEKAIEYIYHWSTQRKKFFDKIDRQLNGKPQFYGDVADLLNILQGEENENK